MKKVKARKGFVDLIILLGAIFILAIVFLLIRQAWSQIEQPLLSDGGLNQDNASKQAVASSDMVASGLDGILVFVFFGMVIVIIALSFFLRSHPVLFFAIIMILLFIIGLAAEFSNIFGDISSDQDLSNANVTMPATNLLFSKLPIMFAVILFIVAIVFFAKRGGGE